MTVATMVEEGVGRLTLNHPPLNILTEAVLADVRAALAELQGVRELRVLVLGAEGKHFSAGADVGEHLPPRDRTLIPAFVETVRAIAEFPLPIVALVQGRCLGGGFELVQAADVIIAAEGATFGQPEILLGVFPPVAAALLPALTDRGRAAEIVFTGDAITAEEASRAGLVWRVVPGDRLGDEALALARRIARHSGAALRAAKRALDAGGEAARRLALERARDIYLDDLMKSSDAVEGLRAFLDKRQPTWTHQ